MRVTSENTDTMIPFIRPYINWTKDSAQREFHIRAVFGRPNGIGNSSLLTRRVRATCTNSRQSIATVDGNDFQFDSLRQSRSMSGQYLEPR